MQNVKLPKVVFGTSGLGNLYEALSDERKCAIVAECVEQAEKPVVFDSAGKYGAGLALESLGKCLKKLNVDPADVLISNKLGWFRTELKTPEPTFEPGVWRNLKYDAIQKISYEGILECYKQGNLLLNGYKAQLVSVHDPDEYLSAGKDKAEQSKRYQDILEAYRALIELKEQGEVKAIGVGSKDWSVIERISHDVQLDWVMIANSMTIHSHPPDLLSFMEKLNEQGVHVINSAVFNSGFLIGSDYYNYQLMNPAKNTELYVWRETFFDLCDQYHIKPAEACVAFSLTAPAVKSIALNTTNANRIEQNVKMAFKKIPQGFWQDMKDRGLIDNEYAYL